MGGINFGWLSGFRAGSVANWRYATYVRCFGEVAAPGGGECGPCPDFASYTLAFALQLRKNHGKPSARVAERRSVDQRRTRFVQSTWPSRAMAWTGLLASAALGIRIGRWGQPTLGQRKYLPSFHTRGFPTSANFGSKHAIRAVMWSANSGTPRSSRISACYLRTRGHQ
jgi:hypothetical protein